MSGGRRAALYEFERGGNLLTGARKGGNKVLKAMKLGRKFILYHRKGHLRKRRKPALSSLGEGHEAKDMFITALAEKKKRTIPDARNWKNGLRERGRHFSLRFQKRGEPSSREEGSPIAREEKRVFFLPFCETQLKEDASIRGSERGGASVCKNPGGEQLA